MMGMVVFHEVFKSVIVVGFSSVFLLKNILK
jgi:hypothetical protein